MTTCYHSSSSVFSLHTANRLLVESLDTAGSTAQEMERTDEDEREKEGGREIEGEREGREREGEDIKGE